MITEEKWTVDDVHVQRGRVAVITSSSGIQVRFSPTISGC